MTYEYLRKYVDQPQNTSGIQRNWFYSLSHEIKELIKKTEEELGYTLPSQLKEFYREIGYGSLTVPHQAPEGYKFYNINRINSPDLILAILEGDPEMVSSDVTFLPGELPFFEVGDGDYFFVMHPQREKPNAVYTQSGILIEEHFEHFIWRLYYEDPGYYNNVIDKYYEDNP